MRIVTSGVIVLAVLVAIAAAGRAQTMLLTRRVDHMVHDGMRDAASGMYVPTSGAVRVRAEVSRARRTGASVELRHGVVAGGNDQQRDAAMRAVASDLPAGSVAVRVDATRWAAAVSAAGVDGRSLPGRAVATLDAAQEDAVIDARLDSLLAGPGVDLEAASS